MKYTFRQLVWQIAIVGALSLTMVSAASAQKVDNEHQVGGIFGRRLRESGKRCPTRRSRLRVCDWIRIFAPVATGASVAP